MKTRQKLWLIAITALLLTLLFALCASAETVGGDCGVSGNESSVKWSLDLETGVMTISGSGDIGTYSSAPYGPYRDYADNIKKIIIEEGVTKIGTNALRDLKNLTEISLPEGLKTIHNQCLKGCTALTEVTIPSTVTNLNYQAFAGCTALKTVILPASVTSLGNQVFSSCSSLTSLVFVGNPTVGTILSSGAKTVLYCADNSNAHTYATNNSFQRYPLVVTGTCGASGSESSVTWSFDASTQTLTISGTGAMADYTNAYTTDPWNDHNALIKHLVINEGVTTVGAYAFGRTTALESVSFPSTLTSIGKYAFSGCSSLDNLTIPGAVVLSDSAFRDCTSLKNLVLEEGKTSISARIFQGCTALKEVVIPASVTNIGFNVTSPFNGCTGLESITFLNPNTEILPATVSGNESTAIPTNAVIKSTGDGKVKTYAEANGYTFVKIALPPLASGTLETGLTWELSADGVLTISGTGDMDNYAGSGDEAPWYDYRTQITSVIISEGVTTIGKRAFNGCAITSVVIPDTVVSIGYNGFRDCKSLTSITIGSGVISIDTYGFNGCSALTSITVPGNVKTIANYAFNGCSKLATIILEEGVETTSNNTFHGCSALTEIVFPSTMVSIGRTNSNPTFVNCTSLKKVVFLNPNTVICVPSTGVAIPEGVTIHGYADSTAEKYATANGNTFVTMNEPFASDCTTAFELTANALTANAGQYLPIVSLDRMSFTDEKAIHFLAVDENGALYVYVNGAPQALLDAEGNAIVLAENTAISIVYNDKNGTARFYVNRDIPTYGEKLAVNVPVADESFLALQSVSDTLTTAEGVTLDNAFTTEDLPAEFAGFQVSTDATAIRVLTGVDMLYYDKVGFEISLYANGVLQGTRTEFASTVFTALRADGEDVTAESCGFNYIAAIKITGIDRTDYPSDTDVHFVVKTFSQIGDEILYGTARNIYISHDGEKHVYTNHKPPYTGEFIPILRFITSSDVHITDSAVNESGEISESSGAGKLRNAIEQILAYAADAEKNDGYTKLDALLLAGDIVNTGTDKQYENAKYIFGHVSEGGILPDETQLVITMGNHDWGNSNALSYEQALEYLAKFESVFGPATRDTVINGYHFITINVDENLAAKGDNGANMKRPYGYDFSEETVALATQLIEAAVADTPDKPIFIIQHVATSDTILGSVENYETEDGKIGKNDTSDSAVPTLFDLQSKYSNLVVFSGHSHAPINDVASIHQEYFTSLNTGVLGGSSVQSRVDGVKLDTLAETNPNVTVSAGNNDDVYLIEVDAHNRVRIRVWDTKTQNFVGETLMVDSFDPFGFKYTEGRYSDSDIFFDGDAVISEGTISTNAITVTFPMVSADSVVARLYKLVATDAEGNETVGYVAPEYYTGQVAPITTTISGLKPNTDYTLEIYAINPMYSYDIMDKGAIYSEPLTATFTTESEASIPAGGDLINLQIDPTSGIAASVAPNGLTSVTNGTPTLSYDSTIGMNVVTFNGDGTQSIMHDFYSVADNLRDGFAIEAYFKVYEANTTADTYAFGAMQSAAFGLVLSEEGTMKFGIHNNTNYTYIETTETYEVGRYYHVVCVYTGSGAALYVDGKLVGEADMADFKLHATASYYKLHIGADNYLSGRIESASKTTFAKFNLYSDPMTADEVAEAYAALSQE